MLSYNYLKTFLDNSLRNHYNHKMFDVEKHLSVLRGQDLQEIN